MRETKQDNVTYHHTPDRKAPQHTDSNEAHEGVERDMILEARNQKSPLADGEFILFGKEKRKARTG
jgi:hypothetical protein